MKTKNIYSGIIFSVIISFISCGPSAEEKAIKEKAKMDSVAQATELNIKQQEATQASEANAKASEEARQETLKNQVIELKAQLAAEDAKMDKIREFHIGRLESEKEQQIAAQTIVIEKLKSDISDMEKQITN